MGLSPGAIPVAWTPRLFAAKRPPPDAVQIPWHTLLPNPEEPGTRISYGTTTNPDDDSRGTKGRPTRTVYRVHATRAELADLLARARAAGCCERAIANLQALLDGRTPPW